MKVGDKVRFKDGFYSYKTYTRQDGSCVTATIKTISKEKYDWFPVKLIVDNQSVWSDIESNLEVLEETK